MRIDEVIQQPGQQERMLKHDIMRSLHVAVPGEVVSYNSDNRTAVIQPVIRDWNSKDNPPLLVDVPVFFSGNYTFTPQKGDGCLVVFADSCIDSWMQSGGVSSPISARTHSMSDGFAFVGFHQTGGTPMPGGGGNKKDIQTPVSDPAADGAGLSFIDSISQNEQGVISPHKKAVQAMTGATSLAAGTAGLVPAPAITDLGKFLKGDGTWGDPPSYSLPLAADGTRGGVQIGYTQNNKKYPVALDNEKMYVDVPWTDSSGDDKLPLAGGTMTGAITFDGVASPIKYKGTMSTKDMIRFIDNTTGTDGNGIAIGGGGLTVIGGGESAATMAATATGGNEKLFLCNDGVIDFYTNCGGGASGASHVYIDNNGAFNGNVIGNVTGNVTGDLTGNASTASKVKDSGDSTDINVRRSSPITSASYFAAWDGYNLRSITMNNLFASLFHEITSNTNMNNLTTPGIYGCTNAATAATLSNCPTDQNFSMLVLTVGGTRVTQILFGGNYIWTRKQTSSSWNPWYRYAGTSVS